MYPHINLILYPMSLPPATSSWIQVNLGQTRKVTGIVIQGCPQNDHWVTKFKLQHSMDGATWTDYTADGKVSHQEVKTSLVQNQTVKMENSLSFWISLISRISQAQQTETLLILSYWVHPCRLSTSASSLWSSAVRQAFASTS